jgi:Flp pilus assembly protein TadD
LVALQVAMKDERRNQALISGDIEYSGYSPMRGEQETDDLNYDRAINKLRFAYEETASAESRLLLARVLVSTAERENTRKALSILAQLEAAGIQSPELFNDRGVVELQLGRYPAAVDYFTKATQGAPDNSRFLFNKALAEQMVGRTAEARKDWNHFISIASEERLKDEARDQLDSLR